MKLIELFEDISDSYLNDPDEIDKVYNPENYEFNRLERQRREEQGTGVITRDLEKDPETRFSNVPKEDSIKTAGYMGSERMKKRLKRDYDKSAFNGDEPNHLTKNISPSNNKPFNIMGK